MGRTVVLFFPWLFFNRISVTNPRVSNFMSAFRTSTKLPINAKGFSYGDKYDALLCDGRTTPKGIALIDAGYTAHPSNSKVPKKIQALRMSYSVCVGDLDFRMIGK